MNSSLISMRQEEIYHFIARSNVVTIQEISEVLHISQSTIRRDIKILEEGNRIVSFHGGVSANTGYGSFSERSSKNIAEKRKIGAAAAAVADHHDFIYVGGGSTTFEFARALTRRVSLRGVTIVCSAMNIARPFIGNDAFKVIVPGGEIRSEDESMTSKITVDTLRNFNFTKAFVGSQAINVKNGYTIPRFDLNEVKMVVAENSKQLILLCDHTKIGKVNPYKVCDISGVGMLITDIYRENEAELRAIEDRGTAVVRV
jgi:DeoR/GlpR family transcriptional regulator of sugar metabolism